jgi:hypothetical protein
MLKRVSEGSHYTSRGVTIVVLFALVSTLVLFALGWSLGRPWLQLLAVPGTGLAAFGLRGHRIPDAIRPTIPEVALAAASVLFRVGSLALLWWLVYWFFVHALDWISDLGGFTLNQSTIAWLVTLVWLGPTYLAFCAPLAREVAGALYPAAGLHSTYYDVLRFRRTSLLSRFASAVVGLCGLTAFLVFADISGNDVGTLLLFSLLFLGGLFAAPESGVGSEPVAEVDVPTVVRSFKDSGWAVVTNPQTGSQDIDPLLADVDVFASKGQRSLLVEVKRGGGETEARRWAAAAGLLTAARELPPSEFPPGVRSCEPVLILVDARPTPSLTQFATDHGISIVGLDSDEKNVHVDAPEELRQDLEALGHRWLTSDADSTRSHFANSIRRPLA